MFDYHLPCRKALWGLSLLGAACTGTVGGSAGDPAQPGSTEASGGSSPSAEAAPGERVTNVADIAVQCQATGGPSVTFTPLRRLNQLEYQDSVFDLLGVEVDTARFVPDSRVGTFSSNVEVVVSDLQADQYRLAAEAAAAKATANLGSIVPCAPSGGEACASTFIGDLGLKAFRRPLTPAEQASYLDVYRTGGVRGGFAGGVGLVIRAMLQSPYFLYQVERTPLGHKAATALGPYEIASRLAYLLWASTPDAALLAAAASGALSTPDQLRAQAIRLLADPRGKKTLGQFQLEWLQLDGVAHLEKDRQMFPSFDAALKQAMKTEVADFFASVLERPEGSYRDLLTAPYALVTGPLLQLYGASSPGPAAAPTRLDFAAGERSGILTQPLFLATHAHQNQGSPVKRGVVIRQAILCQDLPPPPANVNNAPPALSPDLTTRQRFAAHSQDPSCAGCHALIDGIGFGFERYDAVGGYRAVENGRAIDQTGNLVAATPDVEGPFEGPQGLGQKLAASELVRSCFVTQWFRYAYKRQPQASDACTASSMLASFTSSGQNLRELVLSAVATDAFRYGAAEP